MLSVRDISSLLENLAPTDYAYDWDNVGLQLGDPEARVQRVMLALTLTEEVAKAACELEIDLLITHHPFLFKPLKTLRFDQTLGRQIKKLILSGVNVYSAHTNLDLAENGLNDWLVRELELADVQVLDRPNHLNLDNVGLGRIGTLPKNLRAGEVVDLVKSALGVGRVRFIGNIDAKVIKAAVCGGSGGELIFAAHSRGADVIITGDVKFHTALEAKDLGIAIIDAGHFATERLAVRYLMDYLRTEIANFYPETHFGPDGIELFAADETDPFDFI